MTTISAPHRLAELLGALSIATDLGAGVPPEAALRTTFVATRLGAAVGLGGEALADVYYTAVLRYLGCTGFAHEEALAGAGDDLALLATYEAADPARVTEIIALTVKRLGAGRPVTARIGAVAKVLADPHFYSKLARAHCDQAAALASALGMTPAVRAALGEMYERFDGKGAPRGLSGDGIVLPGRILALAQTIEIHRRTSGPSAATAVVKARRGGQFDPALADVFLARPKEFLGPLGAASVWDEYLAIEPHPHRALPADDLGGLAAAFGAYVDLKSPFMLGHSAGVARLAAEAARRAAWPPEEIERVRLSALLHDLGRVSVPNGIWDKPGPLNVAERERVRMHAHHGERILERAPALAPLAAVVGRHHERLDGGGYHRGLGAAGLDRCARLLAACDVHQALTETRAWRAALVPEAAAAALTAEAGAGALDREAVSWVLAAAGQGVRVARGPWPAGLTDREVEVLCLVARGLSNKEVGRALHISAVTVKNHVAHIYEKTGVATRAAAALYAVTESLIN